MEEKEETFIISNELKAALPGIIKSLERDFIPKYNEIRMNQMIDEIETFVGNLVILGEKHSLGIISSYGNELKSYVDNFEIEKISGSLERFPEIIKKIKSLNPVK